MKIKMLKCKSCGEYTLRSDKCPYCGGALRSPHPARFSPDDKYSKYRLKLILSEKTQE
ncbi:MAG: RNA-protein complex protein Nop10 [Candidatus Methanomethyliaceae archaeon]|nr:RNA-protein complex protein Nop10 [Candidatus Methanomethyliaceae archaeon]MDW7970443.1 RNA-protein complex protein Nop10 [Nitrososphaerota archaeon]